MSKFASNQQLRRAILALENGDLFKGTAIGASGSSVGEVVFNTAMTGYQEILTDPSYAKQLITLTHPHIGNTGMNGEDDEAEHLWAAGLIIRDLPLAASSWRCAETLQAYLQRRQVVAIADIDTRRLTRILRQEGAQKGCIQTGDMSASAIATARGAARSFEGLKGMDLAKEVTTAEAYAWQAGSWKLGKGYARLQEARFRVVAYDFGVKRNILRMLVDRGCDLTVVPAQTSAREVLTIAPDGIFLSNGPGDPAPCDYAIRAIRTLLESKTPIFGICLGLQLLGLASGMKTIKMKHGHHGANHPVKNLEDGSVLITSQNHGFCIDDQTLPANVKRTHRSLFDGSLQGIHLTDRPAFGFQGHPEASPGPHDAAPLFDHFIDLMRQNANQQKESSQ